MQQDALSRTFFALSDPTRRAILDRLRSGPAEVNVLAEPFDISLPAISRHLRVLEGAGLITQTRDRQFRTRHIAPEPLRDAADWLATYRSFWEGSLTRLAVHLKETE